jgi:hypothetical protein
MAFDFPASPTEGQIFAPAGGPVYIWQGGVWKDSAGQRSLISDTPPNNPKPGDLWWESDKGNLYIYYADADSSQWVQVNVNTDLVGYLPLTGGTLTGGLNAPGYWNSSGGNSAGIGFAANAKGEALSAPYLALRGNTYSDVPLRNAMDFYVGGTGTAAFGVGMQLTADKYLIVNGAHVTGGGAFLVLTNSSVSGEAGTVYLRPNGYSSSAGEASLVSNGVFTTAASVKAPSYGCRTGESGAYGANRFVFNWTGTVQCWIDSSNVGTIQMTSDYRIKKDVADLGSAWDKIKALRPISYTQAEFTPPAQLEADREAEDVPGPMFPADDIERWGFIAHEVQETLLASAVNGEKDAPNEVQSLNLPAILAATVKALQEAMARIEALEARSGV